jgi:hypothetical protein
VFANQAETAQGRDDLQALFPELLKELLAADVKAEDDESHYTVRNTLVYMVISVANQLGYQSGFRLDPEYPHWPVAYVHLPHGGQVSWHLPEFPDEWDGHSTQEKHVRMRKQIQWPLRIRPFEKPLDTDTSRV